MSIQSHVLHSIKCMLDFYRIYSVMRTTRASVGTNCFTAGNVCVYKLLSDWAPSLLRLVFANCASQKDRLGTKVAFSNLCSVLAVWEQLGNIC